MKFYTTSKISDNIHETPEGYLVCIGVPIARTGEMVYARGETPLEVGPDGRVIVTRDETELFRPETIASFEGKAFTIRHPVEFVGPDNWSTLAKGVMQNVRQGEEKDEDGEWPLLADVLVTDVRSIEMVKAGVREVSCGYEAEYTQTGVGRGVQTNIIGNHLALVEEGRAGPSYAINDHKGKGLSMSKLADKIKGIFAKAQDDALALAKTVDEDGSEKEKKDDKEKAKDEMGAGYDELMTAVKDLGEKVSAMAPKGKDESTKSQPGNPAEIKAKDEEVNASLEDRMKALEMAVAKLLEGQSSEAGDEDSDEITDEEGEESEDEGEEEESLTGDAAARAEILAPGSKFKSKDGKAQALKTAYATADGKKAIDAFTGGKAPTYDSASSVDMLFIGASELLKRERASQLGKTKTRDSEFNPDDSGSKKAPTAEEINKRNAEFYKQT